MQFPNSISIVFVAVVIAMLPTCAAQAADTASATPAVTADNVAVAPLPEAYEGAAAPLPEWHFLTRESLAGYCEESCPPSCTGSCSLSCPPALHCDACPTVYGDVEALYMQRVPRLGQAPIIEDFNSQQTVISTSDFQFDFEPGLRATVGIPLKHYRTLEFTYMGLFQADTSVDVVAGPGELLKVPDPLGSAEDANVFRDMNRATVTYSSTLNSFELNLPCCCCECAPSCDCTTCCDCERACCRSFEWFAGFRYISLGEDLNLLVERQEFGGTETGTYGIHTRDNLYGLQLGARVRRGGGRFRWELTAKAGVYGDDAYQCQEIIDFPNFPLRPTVSAERGLAACVGEMNLSAVYKLTDVWGLRAGYNLMWIEGVALAPGQLDFSFDSASGSSVNTGGGLLLHGVSFGLEGRW